MGGCPLEEIDDSESYSPQVGPDNADSHYVYCRYHDVKQHGPCNNPAECTIKNHKKCYNRHSESEVYECDDAPPA